jgi:ABC-type polysaccharide/polyol phosphate transport system ATPase subunit
MENLILDIRAVSKQFTMQNHKVDSIKEAFANVFLKPKTSGSFTALNKISIQLNRGEAIGIIGRNGAGKSTLLKILAGILQPDEGEIDFYGKAVSILDIGAGFHPELTGRENVFFSAGLYGFSNDEILKHFYSIVEFSGIENFIDEPVKNYSSGMYLRLAFSIIAFLDADIYLIDEVINVGDANFQAKCKQRMEELRAAGKLLVIASHNLNEIISISNRVVWLDAGNVVAMGGSEVIQAYLKEVLPQQMESNLKNGFEIQQLLSLTKNDESVSIVSNGIKNYTTTKPGLLDIRYPFEIFFDVDVKQLHDRVIRLKIFDATGILVFICSTLQEQSSLNSPGHYHVSFAIPSNIFNCRMYHVDFSLIDYGSQQIIYSVEKMIHLSFGSDESELIIRDRLPGVISPNIQLTIKIT